MAAMKEDCLISINYDFATRTATLIYEPDSEYDTDVIAEYVEEMTDDTCRIIDIYEGDEQMWRLARPAPAINGDGIARH
jgi:hypothetical protein